MSLSKRMIDALSDREYEELFGPEDDPLDDDGQDNGELANN